VTFFAYDVDLGHTLQSFRLRTRNAFDLQRGRAAFAFKPQCGGFGFGFLYVAVFYRFGGFFLFIFIGVRNFHDGRLKLAFLTRGFLLGKLRLALFFGDLNLHFRFGELDFLLFAQYLDRELGFGDFFFDLVRFDFIREVGGGL
jgi:hypothetical protein